MPSPPTFTAQEPPPQFGDLLLALWSRKLLIGLLAAACAGAGYLSAELEQTATYRQEARLPAFDLERHAPGMLRDFRQAMATAEGAPTWLKQRLAAKGLALEQVVSLQFDEEADSYDLRANGSDRNIVATSFAHGYATLLGMYAPMAEDGLERARAYADELRIDIAEAQKAPSELSSGLDLDVAMKKVQSLFRVRQSILLEALREGLDKAETDRRLDAVDAEIEAVDITAARRMSKIQSVYLEEYETAVRGFTRTQDRIAALEKLIPELPERLVELSADEYAVTRQVSGPSRRQRTAYAGAFGLFMGVLLALALNAVAEAQKTREESGSAG